MLRPHEDVPAAGRQAAAGTDAISMILAQLLSSKVDRGLQVRRSGVVLAEAQVRAPERAVNRRGDERLIGEAFRNAS